VLLNSLRRRTRAKHRFGPKARIASGDRPARISAGVLHQAGRHQGCRLGQEQRGSYLGSRSHPGRIAGERTLVTGAWATRCGSEVVDQTPALPVRCRLEPGVLTGHRPDASVSASPSPVVFTAAAGQPVAAGEMKPDQSAVPAGGQLKVLVTALAQPGDRRAVGAW
jgi:hypothetical protein